MKKFRALVLMCILCISLAACGEDETQAPPVKNPPQSEQLSYETNKDGYITSCTVSIGGETFTYQCEGNHYLIVAEDHAVISEYAPSQEYWSGTEVKRINFYPGTAKAFVIRDFRLDEDLNSYCERIKVCNLAGEVVVDKTPRQGVEEYYFGLRCDIVNPPLLTAEGEQAKDADGNFLLDDGAIAIHDTCFQKADRGVIICGRLESTTYYDTETGNVIYSRIYDPLDATCVVSVYDRAAFYLTYREILGIGTITKQWHEPDGSYSEKVTDLYGKEVISQGNYRDIATNLSSDRVAGSILLQETLTPESLGIPPLEKLEDIMSEREVNEGIYYRVKAENPDKYYFQKFDGKTLLWSVDCSEFSYPYYELVSDGILIYGDHMDTQQALLCKYDFDGNLLWRDQRSNGFYGEYYVDVLELADGSYAAIGRGHSKSYDSSVCLSLFTADGNRTLYETGKADGTAVNAAKLTDGYLVRLHTGTIVKLDNSGKLTASFGYTGGGGIYQIQYMAEFNGKIWLSAYTTPALREDERTFGGRTEIARILQFVHDRKDWDIPSEELTPLVRENYTAVLLVCDPDSGIPQEFYSAEGAMGGALRVSEGKLLWDVESIVTTLYSPGTSSFTIAGTNYVLRYAFDGSGDLTGPEKTGETTDFRR